MSELLRFDQAIAPGGYAWWYIDAISDDGSKALALIVFLGSAFSPYYAAARARGPAYPIDHCAINVALYADRSRRWAMTERGRAQVEVRPDALAIGPSHCLWDGACLTISIDEVTAPVPSRLKGTVRVYPAALSGREFSLDVEQRHSWRPLAPCSRVEVDFGQPALRWHGPGYLDANSGSVPLSQSFRHWNWSRGRLNNVSTLVFYDIEHRNGGATSLALEFDAAGEAIDVIAPPAVALAPSSWKLARSVRSETSVDIRRPLEDGPFYSRAIVSTSALGQPMEAIHECLSLDRLRQRWVNTLLPFRMPRRAG